MCHGFCTGGAGVVEVGREVMVLQGQSLWEEAGSALCWTQMLPASTNRPTAEHSWAPQTIWSCFCGNILKGKCCLINWGKKCEKRACRHQGERRGRGRRCSSLQNRDSPTSPERGLWWSRYFHTVCGEIYAGAGVHAVVHGGLHVGTGGYSWKKSNLWRAPLESGFFFSLKNCTPWREPTWEQGMWQGRSGRGKTSCADHTLFPPCVAQDKGGEESGVKEPS